MSLLPIVERELRVAARRPITYRARFWAVTAAIAFTVWKVFNFATQGLPVALQGRSLFATTCVLAFSYALLMGARLTADCLSGEKREGTLGLLFLTDLKPWDVVFGKLVANSVNSIYGLLAIVPVMALPLLLGGVTFIQVLQMSLLLLNTLFFSLCVGIMVSVLSRNDRKAMLGTLLVILVSISTPIALFIFRMFVRETVRGPADLVALVPWLVADPLYGLVYLIGPRIPMVVLPQWSFWVSLGIVHALSWCALLVAMLLVPHVWKERVSRGIVLRVKTAWEQWSRGVGPARAAFRRRWLAVNPYVWLMSRDRLKPVYAWIFLGSVVLIWLRGYDTYGDVMFDFYPLIPTAILIHMVIKLWVLAEACHRLTEDRRSGALELLLATPLTIPRILEGQFVCLRRQFALPLLVLAVIELGIFFQWYSWTLITAGLIMLVADAVVLVWVGTYLSLSGRSMNRVFVASAGLVLLLPWALTIAVDGLLDWMRHYRIISGLYSLFSGDGSLRFESRVWIWFAIGMLNNAVLGLGWARTRLLRAQGL